MNGNEPPNMPYGSPGFSHQHYTSQTEHSYRNATKGRLSGTNKTWLIVLGSVAALVLVCCVGFPLAGMLFGSSTPATSDVLSGVSVAAVDLRAHSGTQGYEGFITVKNHAGKSWEVGYHTVRFVLKKDGRVVVVLKGQNSTSGRVVKADEEWVVEVYPDYSTPYEAGPYKATVELE